MNQQLNAFVVLQVGDAGAAAWPVLLGLRAGMALRGVVLNCLSICCFFFVVQRKFCIPMPGFRTFAHSLGQAGVLVKALQRATV